ncbi:MAG: tetratricopeptide repeat protein [Gaiellaceae bacterium]
MTSPDTTTRVRSSTGPRTGNRVGERLRQLRVAAGLTQSELAGQRFSKEYLSQIERGKTRPTQETIEWLAARLVVDPGYLASGVSTDERGRVEAALARADALTRANRTEEALREYETISRVVRSTGSIELEVRALSGEAWARQLAGDVRPALEQLTRARTIIEGPGFSDMDCAEVLFRIGVCRYKLQSIATALGLFTEALTLVERSELPGDHLRSEVLGWRSRCYRRQRDFEAAREDVEAALELSQGLEDRRSIANTCFQASLVAERLGQLVQARTYAERAKALYEQLSDEVQVGRLLNNLGGLNHMLGRSEQAVENLKAAFAVALEHDTDADAATAAGSLARVHLDREEHADAERLAREGLKLLHDRADYASEIAMTQLVLGRALMEQDRLDEADEWLTQADTTAELAESASHRSAVWVARGDLAGRRGEDRTAARYYRRAAEALQDVRF